jgi:hypothetical protein
MSATTLPIGFAPPDWQFALCSCSAFDAALPEVGAGHTARELIEETLFALETLLRHGQKDLSSRP